jgi:hypothetical protein
MDPYFIVLALVLSYPAIMFAVWLKRRARLREFAARHEFHFRGILPSDKYAPYTRFHYVSRAVLLYNVMEGRWNDFDVAIFDFPMRRGSTCTGAIVSLPNDFTRFQVVPDSIMPGVRAAVGERLGDWTRVSLDQVALDSSFAVLEALDGTAAAGIGSRTAALLRSGPSVFLETNVGHLLVTPMRQIAPDDVPEFIGVVSSFARALDADARSRQPSRQLPGER